jgi:hypothetical protein
MIYHNHTTIDIKYHVTEYDIAPNIHLLVACSARGSLISVTAIDPTPTLKRNALSLGTADRS